MIPTLPRPRQPGSAAIPGRVGTGMLSDWLRIWFGLVSHWWASSLGAMGKVPVGWSGRSFELMMRVAPVLPKRMDSDDGHDTLPSTLGLAVRSNVPASSSIQGPAVAPGPLKVVWHEVMAPTCGEVVITASRGKAVRSTPVPSPPAAPAARGTTEAAATAPAVSAAARIPALRARTGTTLGARSESHLRAVGPRLR